MSTNVNKRKKVIGVICNNKELFLSLKRALSIFFPKTDFYFYDISILHKDRFNDVQVSGNKNGGVLIAFFTGDEENIKISQLIKYLRIKRELRFSLIFSSFSRGEELQKRYDVLTYGGNSHLYQPFPIDLDTLFKSISSAYPMSVSNYALFCKEYSERHKEFYKKRVLPLLKKADRETNQIKWLNDLERLINDMTRNTPSTCHEKVEYSGEVKSLADHLMVEIIGLKKLYNEKETFHRAELSKIRTLLDYWFKVVSNKTFE